MRRLIVLISVVAVGSWLVPPASGAVGWTIGTGAPVPAGASPNLNGVSVVPGEKQAWAVGRHGSLPLTEHWNGSAWVKLRSVARPEGGYLTSVSARSRTDAWAAGHGQAGLLEHWSGGHWTVVNVPTSMTLPSVFTAVLDTSDRRLFVGSNDGTIIEHDGGVWSVEQVDVFAPFGAAAVTGFTSVPGSKQVWAVGYELWNNIPEPAAWLWDGSEWNGAPIRYPGVSFPGGGAFQAITAFSTSDIWVVGGAFTQPGGVGNVFPFAEHWNGTEWTIVGVPSPQPGADLTGITRIPARHALWISGTVNSNGAASATILHWSQARGFTEPLLDENVPSELAGIVASARDGAFAVGSQQMGGAERPLVARHS